MGLAPRPDALDMGRAAAGITVVGGLQPTARAGRFASLAARGLGAVALPPRAARVGSKEGLTVRALVFGEWTSHGPVSPQAHERKIVAWKEANREEKTGRRRAKKTEEGDKYPMEMGRRRTGLNDNFNWTVSSQFLIVADTREVGVNPNGIQFRYNSFPIKQLRRLAHFVLFCQDGGIHSHYP